MNRSLRLVVLLVAVFLFVPIPLFSQVIGWGPFTIGVERSGTLDIREIILERLRDGGHLSGRWRADIGELQVVGISTSVGPVTPSPLPVNGQVKILRMPNCSAQQQEKDEEIKIEVRKGYTI